MKIIQLTSFAALALSAVALLAAPPASDNDKTFESKASQGGMYEVEAGRLAETRAHAQNVKNLAIMEVHDHTLARSAEVTGQRAANPSGRTACNFHAIPAPRRQEEDHSKASASRLY